MKNGTLLLLLLVAGFAFGQSAKKVNLKLRQELLVEKQKQDSAFREFQHDWYILRQFRKEVDMKMTGPFSKAEQKAREKRYAVESTSRMLKDLGVPEETFAVDSLPEVMPYHVFYKPFRKSMNAFIQFDKVEPDPGFELENHKLREQNEWLAALIRKYKDFAVMNENSFYRQEELINEVKQFGPLIDSMIEVYNEVSIQMSQTHQVLSGRLNELKANYQKKGPKGFSDAYRVIFPDVHPVHVVKEDLSVGRWEDINRGEVYQGLDEVPVVEVDEPVMVPPAEREQDQILMVLDEPASFPGGIEAMKTYISKNLRYPEIMKEAGISGKVFVRFVVSEAGDISNVEVMKGLSGCRECDLEVMRLIRGMPKWLPGKNKGKMVKSYFNLPVNFSIQ